MEKTYDWKQLLADFGDLLKVKATPTGLKFLENKADLEGINRLARPQNGERFTACQLIGQATRWQSTVGFTLDDLVAPQCAPVLGLEDPAKFLQGTHMQGVWFETADSAVRHQNAMYLIPPRYQAVVAYPLKAPVFPAPDLCLVYGTPQQMVLLGNALQYEDFETITMSFVGESSCSDSWGKAMVTGKPAITVPCYGERLFGGVLDEEMLAVFPPQYFEVIVSGLKKLKKNGVRYPAPTYGNTHDVRPQLAAIYGLDILEGRA